MSLKTVIFKETIQEGIWHNTYLVEIDGDPYYYRNVFNKEWAIVSTLLFSGLGEIKIRVEGNVPFDKTNPAKSINTFMKLAMLQ